MENKAPNDKFHASSEPEVLNIKRSEKLNILKQQINDRSKQIADAQEEIERVRVILADARSRLESMKTKAIRKCF